ncbi:MAG: ArsR/SmtB family transcription factor [Candidatus Binatia bacterium]
MPKSTAENAPSERLYDELARLAGALASPTRLRALNLLFQGPKPVEALAELLGESEANTAAHMKVLRSAGLVIGKRSGKRIFQEPSSDVVLELFLALRNAGESVSPAVMLLSDGRDETSSDVTQEALQEMSARRSRLLLDLRPRAEFDSGHIPGARSFPFSDLRDRIAELPLRRRILAYCRGKYCPTARTGVLALREVGLHAERLPFGVAEWRAAGHPVAIGPNA